jgi:hypothetical protein
MEAGQVVLMLQLRLQQCKIGHPFCCLWFHHCFLACHVTARKTGATKKILVTTRVCYFSQTSKSACEKIGISSR